MSKKGREEGRRVLGRRTVELGVPVIEGMQGKVTITTVTH